MSQKDIFGEEEDDENVRGWESSDLNFQQSQGLDVEREEGREQERERERDI